MSLKLQEYHSNTNTRTPRSNTNTRTPTLEHRYTSATSMWSRRVGDNIADVPEGEACCASSESKTCEIRGVPECANGLKCTLRKANIAYRIDFNQRYRNSRWYWVHVCSSGAGPATKPSDAKLDCDDADHVLCDYTGEKDDEAEPTDLQVCVRYIYLFSSITHSYHLHNSPVSLIRKNTTRILFSNINTRTPTPEHRYEWRDVRYAMIVVMRGKKKNLPRRRSSPSLKNWEIEIVWNVQRNLQTVLCWTSNIRIWTNSLFGICIDNTTDCPDGHEVIREVTKCPIEPSNVKFKEICTQGNVCSMSSNAPKSQRFREKVCDDGNFKTNLAALSKRLVTHEQDCAAYCENTVKLDGTEITGAEHGVCSDQGLAEVKTQAKAAQKASQNEMKARTQVHNKEFQVRIDYADVHFRKAYAADS